MKEIIIPLAVGLTIFLFGLQVMRIGLEQLAGDKLKKFLIRFTSSPSRGFFTGTIVTALMQSSSAVTVITIGLTNARLLTFPQTIGIILGANVGSTVTPQLIALNISDYALPTFAIGCSLWFLKNHIVRCVGLALAGFGCVFLGMDAMQMIAEPIRETGLFQDLIFIGADNNAIGVFVGAALTAAIQSSAATTAITMNFMSEHLVPLTMAIAIILGSNIGTCATALIAAIGGNTASVRVAWCHTILNILGVVLFIPLIGGLALLTTMLTNHPPSQVAHAQTIFNVVCSLLALPFANRFAKLIEYVVPNKKS